MVTLLGTWGEHYRFWKKNSKNFLLIKYENLIENTYLELEKLIEFLKNYLELNISEEKKKNIIETTNFQNLKNMEKKRFI